MTTRRRKTPVKKAPPNGTQRKRAKARSKLGPLLEPPPAKALAIAKELQRLEGVLCVVWGSRKTGKRWFHDDFCLSVHVQRKGEEHEYPEDTLPDTLAELRKVNPANASKRPLPKYIDGFRIDVLPVGTPQLQSLSAAGRLDAGSLGISTPTVVATDGTDALVLASGHGARDTTKIRLDGVKGASLKGRFGQGRSVDWALVRFDGAAHLADTSHPAAGTRAPLRLAGGAVGGAVLTQFSGERGARVDGILQGVVTTNIDFGGVVFSSLLSILRKADQPSFSIDGDSGSLIVDNKGRAVAAIVGGDINAGTFYAYDLRGLAADLTAAEFALFFEGP